MTVDSDPGVFAADVPARPRLAADVSVHPPRSDGAPWVLERDGRRYFRVGPDMARLAELLTGDYDHDELLGILGPRWTAPALHAGVATLQKMSLIDDGRQRSFSSQRLNIVPPMTIQFSVLDPSRVLPHFSPVIRLLSRRSARIVSAALVLGGLLALALNAGDVRRLLESPVPNGIILLLVVGAFLGTVIHEFAHGATLMHYGGRPRRMGVMLLYLFPAFFCDVSDGWLLSDRLQRVKVALAGIFAQLVIAGSAGVVGAVLPGSIVRDGLLLFAASTYLAAVVNLLPFIKLDGYLALMSVCDVPHLRTEAMNDARNFLARVLYGARAERKLPWAWGVPYGLACMVFPLYLIGGVAFALWGELAQGAGLVGALMIFGFLCGLLFAIGRGFVRLQQAARASGAGLARLVFVNLVLAAGLVAALVGIRVAEEVPGYYRIDDDRAQVLVPTTAATDRVEPGQLVELRSNGVVLRTLSGEARVGSGEPVATTVRMSELMPVAADTGLGVEVVEMPLEVVEAPRYEFGVTRVVVGDESLWDWLVARYVTPMTSLW